MEHSINKKQNKKTKNSLIYCNLLIFSSTLMLSGCAVGAAMAGTALSAPLFMGGNTVTDETLKERAAFTLATSSDKVKISNRKKDGSTIYFTAKAKGKESQCYVTTSPLATSDAICNNDIKESKNNSSSCNALLRAANKCK